MKPVPFTVKGNPATELEVESGGTKYKVLLRLAIMEVVDQELPLLPNGIPQLMFNATVVTQVEKVP